MIGLGSDKKCCKIADGMPGKHLCVEMGGTQVKVKRVGGTQVKVTRCDSLHFTFTIAPLKMAQTLSCISLKGADYSEVFAGFEWFP